MMHLKSVFQMIFCTLIATFSALTTHIYVAKWVQPYIDAIMEQAAENGINFSPDTSTYSALIIGVAYLTAIIMVAIYVFLYYHAQHLIPGKNTFAKTIFVTAILFGLKGDLIRQPIMNFIMNYELMNFFIACKFVVLDHIDKWLANIFLAISLVALCPKKFKN